MNEKRNNLMATARCHPKDKADNRGVAEGEDGYFNETAGLPVGIHRDISLFVGINASLSFSLNL
jgi:hypothetical protein